MIHHYKNTGRGFSLIELLVALSILAVVAAIIVPRFLSVRSNAILTTGQAQAKELNNIWNQWVGLGGTANSPTPANAILFLSTTGNTASSQRGAVPVAQMADSIGAMGSANIQIGGINVSATPAAITGASPDGLLISNGTSTPSGSATNSGDIYFKTGGMILNIGFNPANTQPFTAGASALSI